MAQCFYYFVLTFILYRYHKRYARRLNISKQIGLGQPDEKSGVCTQVVSI